MASTCGALRAESASTMAGMKNAGMLLVIWPWSLMSSCMNFPLPPGAHT